MTCLSADIGANQLCDRRFGEHQTAWNVPTENTESYPPPATRRSQPSAPAAAFDDDGGSLPKLLVFSVCDDFGDRDRGEMWEI